jgi:arylsulfatase A-like enzyme
MTRRSRRRALGALAVAGAATAVGLAAWYRNPPRPEPPPRAIVLVTIDTLRADHLGCYGYLRPTSPFLDGLAGKGVLFENAYSSISHTTPAHATLFTGLYPAQHRVLRNGEGFAGSLIGDARLPYGTMAELLARAGYETAAFAGVGFLRPIARGFATVSAHGDWRQYKQADAVVTDAVRFVATKRPADRFFLWVHLFDPHAPDRAPEDVLGRFRFPSPEEEATFARQLQAARGIPEGFHASPADLAQAFTRYDAEVAFADRELGRLFAAMEGRGLNARALWIVTADHGEGLGSHGYGGHGLFVYNEQIRVPLILYEGGRRTGTRVRDLVRHVDVLPTLAERLAVPFAQPGFTLPGRSLGPLLRARWGALPPATLFAERRPPDEAHQAVWEPGDVFSVQDLEWKYVVHTEGKDELFDLRADPLELANLVDDRAARGARERLGRLARDTRVSLAREGGRVRPSPFDPRLREELRALGYVN